jgi:hypothetical protein
MRRGRLTALAPSSNGPTRVRAPFPRRRRGSSRRARGPGVADRIVQEGDAFASDPTAFSPVLVAQLGFRGGLWLWRAGVRTHRTGHRRSMSAVHIPHKRIAGSATPTLTGAPPSRARGAADPGVPAVAVAASLAAAHNSSNPSPSGSLRFALDVRRRAAAANLSPVSVALELASGVAPGNRRGSRCR